MISRGPAYHERRIKKDCILIVVCTLLAIVLSQTDFFKAIILSDTGFAALNCFIAGIFFTSLFTTPFAIVAFLILARTTSLLSLAFWGACGAAVGDMILFLFIRDNLADDIAYVLRAPKYKKFFLIFRQRMFRYITPFIGALIIASPFPDELGLAMLGLSRTKTKVLAPLLFLMNFLGILLVGLAALSFS